MAREELIRRYRAALAKAGTPPEAIDLMTSPLMLSRTTDAELRSATQRLGAIASGGAAMPEAALAGLDPALAELLRGFSGSDPAGN